MRRLSSNSRKNRIYKAFREVGRVMRTVALLRFLVEWNSLLCNLIVFHTAIDMMEVIRQLVAEGWQVTAEDLASSRPT